MKTITATMIMLSLCFLCGCKRKEKVSDDLQWMNNTYNPSGIAEGGNPGHGRSGWYVKGRNGDSETLAEGTMQTFSSDGCKITTWIEPDLAAQRDIETELILKFTLRDIDPDTIKIKTYSHFGGFLCEDYSAAEREAMGIDCDHAEMTASTRNAASVVDEESHEIFKKLAGKDHDSYGKIRESRVYFGFDDIDYATSFARTFRDAVIECGGTKGAGH